MPGFYPKYRHSDRACFDINALDINPSFCTAYSMDSSQNTLTKRALVHKLFSSVRSNVLKSK